MSPTRERLARLAIGESVVSRKSVEAKMKLSRTIRFSLIVALSAGAWTALTASDVGAPDCAAPDCPGRDVAGDRQASQRGDRAIQGRSAELVDDLRFGWPAFVDARCATWF